MAKQDWSPRGLKTGCEVVMHREVESDPDISWIEGRVKDGERGYIKEGVAPAKARRYAGKDRERLEAFQRQEWWMTYVYGSLEFEDRNGETVTIRSGGLGNVESDAGKSYLNSIAKEEIADLLKQMESLGYRCLKKPRIRWSDHF